MPIYVFIQFWFHALRLTALYYAVTYVLHYFLWADNLRSLYDYAHPSETQLVRKTRAPCTDRAIQNHETLQVRQPVSEPSFELGTFRKGINRAAHITAVLIYRVVQAQVLALVLQNVPTSPLH